MRRSIGFLEENKRPLDNGGSLFFGVSESCGCVPAGGFFGKGQTVGYLAAFRVVGCSVGWSK